MSLFLLLPLSIRAFKKIILLCIIEVVWCPLFPEVRRYHTYFHGHLFLDAVFSLHLYRIFFHIQSTQNLKVLSILLMITFIFYLLFLRITHYSTFYYSSYNLLCIRPSLTNYVHHPIKNTTHHKILKLTALYIRIKFISFFLDLHFHLQVIKFPYFFQFDIC